MLKKLTPIIQRTLLRQIAAPTSNGIISRSRSETNTGVSMNSIYEPDYLDSLKPKFPQYESLNVQMKGYDFPLLESYQRYVHSIAEYLNIDVSDCYALPPQQTQVQRLRPNSTVVDAEYKLTMYERNLQMADVDAPLYPIFLRMAQAALPEGVQLVVREHTDECEERRYVPDKELLDLKAELENSRSHHPGGFKKK